VKKWFGVMVFAVRCPNPKCRKFMLVEEGQRGQVVPCLICKEAIRIPAQNSDAKPPSASHRNHSPHAH